MKRIDTSPIGWTKSSSDTVLLVNVSTKTYIRKFCEELGEDVPPNLDQMTGKAAAELQIKLWQRTAKYKAIRTARLSDELEQKLDNEISDIRSKMEEAA